MVVLMGGRASQGYQLFQQLTVKAYLAIRPHADQLVSTVQLMLDTCLPSFKGEPTIRRLRDRFALSLNERQAAEYMMSIVRNAHENVRSTAYDEFQRVSAASHVHSQGSHILYSSKTGYHTSRVAWRSRSALVTLSHGVVLLLDVCLDPFERCKLVVATPKVRNVVVEFALHLSPT